MKFVYPQNKKFKVEAKGQYLERAEISLKHTQEMYAIYACYYENTNFDLFVSDLDKKSGAILIFDTETKIVVGFSTIVLHQFSFGRKKYSFLFSGDTIIKREFWGTRALQTTFVKLALKLRFQYPLDEFYWLLISKGYKTYLLMANNYYIYYPNLTGKFESLAPVLKYYCNTYFPEYYDQETGLINFGSDYQPLKGEVAPITDKMREENPKISFFEQQNPTWKQGTELPCIGYMGWNDFVRYPFRFLSKAVSKGKQEASAYAFPKPDENVSC